MPLRSEFTLLPAELEMFLFAPLWDDARGAPVSVLSAFARLDIDPWVEAARLAALPREAAAAALTDILNRLPGRGLGAPSVAPIAAGLVTLLPEHDPHAPAQGDGVAVARADATTRWLLLAFLASLAIAAGNWWF